MVQYFYFPLNCLTHAVRAYENILVKWNCSYFYIPWRGARAVDVEQLAHSQRTVGRRLKAHYTNFKISLFCSSAHDSCFLERNKESKTKKRICLLCCAKTLWHCRRVSRRLKKRKQEFKPNFLPCNFKNETALIFDSLSCFTTANTELDCKIQE